MTVTPAELIALASELADGQNEAAWRSSASRAYYASYHQAQAVVSHCPDNAHLAMGSHERLTDRFELQGSKGAKSISLVLKSMKRVRHLADYDLNDSFIKALAEQQIAQHFALDERLVTFQNLLSQKTA